MSIHLSIVNNPILPVANIVSKDRSQTDSAISNKIDRGALLSNLEMITCATSFHLGGDDGGGAGNGDDGAVHAIVDVPPIPVNYHLLDHEVPSMET